VHSIDWREYLVALTCAVGATVIVLRLLVWWETRLLLAEAAAEPPIGDQIWRVLEEARRITAEAAEDGH
jgi:hypothetical protein